MFADPLSGLSLPSHPTPSPFPGFPSTRSAASTPFPFGPCARVRARADGVWEAGGARQIRELHCQAGMIYLTNISIQPPLEALALSARITRGQARESEASLSSPSPRATALSLRNEGISSSSKRDRELSFFPLYGNADFTIFFYFGFAALNLFVFTELHD